MITLTIPPMFVLLGSIGVAGMTVCPTPAEVQALIPTASTNHPTSDRAEIVQVRDRLVVRLLDGHGDLLAERHLAIDRPCDGLAGAAAALVWIMELEASMTPGVDLIVPAWDAPVRPTVIGPQAKVPSGPGKRVSLDMGAALLGAIDPDGATLAGGVTLGLRPRGLALRPEAGLFVSGTRDLSLQVGGATYQRYWLSLGMGYEVSWGRLSLEPQVAVLGALLDVQGGRVTSMTRDVTLDSGGAGGLVLLWSLGKSAVWGGVFGSWWWGETTVQIGTLGQARQLPSLEALLGAGMRFAVL